MAFTYYSKIKMKIGVIGAGRSSICFAPLCEAAGYDVLVSDIRQDYVDIETMETEVDNHLKVVKNLEATSDNRKEKGY